MEFRTQLGGCVDDWVRIETDIDAMVCPLGLSGVYTIRGLEPDEATDRQFPLELPPGNSAGRAARTAWMRRHEERWQQREDAAAFEVTLTPKVTVMHLMAIAATEYTRRHGLSRGDRAFALFEIHDRVITFAIDH